MSIWLAATLGWFIVYGVSVGIILTITGNPYKRR